MYMYVWLSVHIKIYLGIWSLVKLHMFDVVLLQLYPGKFYLVKSMHLPLKL